MTSESLRDARSALVRDRVLEGVAAVLTAGDDLTFAKVAKAAGVPERTVYRHFPTREALLTAVFGWANRRIGFDGPDPDGAGPGSRPAAEPVTGAEAADLVRRVFAGFDEIAPVVRELLRAPEGLFARLSDNDRRRRAARGVVDREAPGLDEASARRVAAVVQVLTAAATWQTLRDYWDVDGVEAGEAAALAIQLLLDGARARAQAGP
ncbi:helix-turn-helix transcriptional regulator [Frankia sp. CNm7]|uniref:Helix-turn-helix transcriptional regulator n=1 Tax=Frankia nepalensis TaxID=1836974 RepID=A0A937UN18_9ACTN|nr:helix-turn-helix domain-containing protein [Frankia nepalensis]MBL7497376.1 helix-turn-helix transcriptional regulator [Frankia nepalensis]MBL7512766.1 helix-turn-helix transcriptional regulator [Frankia nepalensis]MBL7522516.1 helix-turn-helix transcriptional regulator [Frankia nepalensis]MBL7629414.1 helix-turn-helix transcriptional regulator [Frankia nepalensis]